jgi:hypothetical protein
LLKSDRAFFMGCKILAEPPPGPQFWGSKRGSKPPELGVWGPEITHQTAHFSLCKF